MIEIDNPYNFAIPEKTIQNIADSLTDRDIDLMITDNSHIQKINQEHRNIDSATDVLSFPFNPMPMGPLGSIVISLEYVKQLSVELGHSEDDEFCLLFIHGLLHLLGYDHETDNGEMRDKEMEIIAAFNLPDSLIVRTQEK